MRISRRVHFYVTPRRSGVGFLVVNEEVARGYLHHLIYVTLITVHNSPNIAYGPAIFQIECRGAERVREGA
jgi:hypothetical protein